MWRLPVTASSSLLRFKSSVCKSSWRPALIQTSFFVDLHTTTTTTSTSTKFCGGDDGTGGSKFGSFILQTTEPSVDPDEYADDIKMFMLSSGPGDGNDEEEDNQNKKKKMVFKMDDLDFLPFYKDFLLQDSLRMVGSCNGIICLHDPKLSVDSKHYTNLRDVSLWNPATRQFRTLPKSITIVEKQHYIDKLEDFIALGFDVKTKDYKVLRITPWEDDDDDDDELEEKEGCMCRVQVYSLSTDSWRLLDGIYHLPVTPNQDMFQNHGIYLNGSYFFVRRKPCTDDFMLLSFDFTKEIFTIMQLPDDNSHNSVLSCLGDKMAVFTTTRIDWDGGYWYYDIWVSNEQHGSGSKESWTKLHSFEIKTKRGQSYSGPRCISNDGEFALISTMTGNWRNKLQLFNLVTKEAKKDFTIGDWDCRAAYVYNKSQVSIMGGNVLLRWQLPTHGTTYKLNLDAHFTGCHDSFGIGLCLTSDTGGCIGVRSLHRGDVSAKKGEALAILEAIKWAKKLELSPIIIESNSKNCVSFFMEDDDDDDNNSTYFFMDDDNDEDDNNSTYWCSEAFSLLSEAKLLINSSELDSISFQYCSGSCNYVADIAARLGREGSWSCKDWTANFPGEIVMSLSKDLGLETR